MMKLKKQIIGSSLLSLGLLTGGSFIGNTSVFAAGDYSNLIKYEKLQGFENEGFLEGESKYFQEIKNMGIFDPIKNPLRKISETKMSTLIIQSGVLNKNQGCVNIRGSELLEKLGVDSQIIEKFKTLTYEEKQQLFEEVKEIIKKIIEKNVKGQVKAYLIENPVYSIYLN